MVASLLIPGQHTEAAGGSEPLCVDLLYALHHLEQPGAARDAVGLKAGGHSQADGLVGAARIRHYQIRGQRVVVTICEFGAGIQGSWGR